MTTATAPKPPSDARLIANRRNAQKSTGPKTEEGKARARQNAVKHGMAGTGICLPSEDQAVVEGRFAALRDELGPKSTLAGMMVYQVALAFTRIERAARQETASIALAQRQVGEAFDEAQRAAVEEDVTPIGEGPARQLRRAAASPEAIARARAEAVERALFDSSREACLARRYAAAAERQFYRSLREFRDAQAELAAFADDPAPPEPQPASRAASTLAMVDAPPARRPAAEPPRPTAPAGPTPRPELASFGDPLPKASPTPSQPPSGLPQTPSSRPMPAAMVSFTIGKAPR